jgi:hypothetical protein
MKTELRTCRDPIDEPGSYSGFMAPRLLRFLKERL